MWRKNRAPKVSVFRGVDLNRNFDFLWGERHRQQQRTAATQVYRGPAPLLRAGDAQRALADRQLPQHRLLHGRALVRRWCSYPWGDDRTRPPIRTRTSPTRPSTGSAAAGRQLYKEFIPAADQTRSHAVAGRVTDAIRRCGAVSQPMQGVGLYPTSGTSDDYAYSGTSPIRRSPASGRLVRDGARVPAPLQRGPAGSSPRFGRVVRVLHSRPWSDQSATPAGEAAPAAQHVASPGAARAVGSPIPERGRWGRRGPAPRPPAAPGRAGGAGRPAAALFTFAWAPPWVRTGGRGRARDGAPGAGRGRRSGGLPVLPLQGQQAVATSDDPAPSACRARATAPGAPRRRRRPRRGGARTPPGGGLALLDSHAPAARRPGGLRRVEHRPGSSPAGQPEVAQMFEFGKRFGALTAPPGGWDSFGPGNGV